MADEDTGEILEGLWRFEARHPGWEGQDDWDPVVAWWAVRSPMGIVLVDPLITDWEPVDGLIKEDESGCAGIIRTCHWHQRSVTEAAARYSTTVWSLPPAGGVPPPHRRLEDWDRIFDGMAVKATERRDELALWAPDQSALIFADAMVRDEEGMLRICPDRWPQPPGGREQLQEMLRGLAWEHEPQHVLVSHGPLVLGDGAQALRDALED